MSSVFHTKRYRAKKVPLFRPQNEFARRDLSVKNHEFYKDSPFTLSIKWDEDCPVSELPTDFEFEFMPKGAKSFVVINFAAWGGSFVQPLLNEQVFNFGEEIPLPGFAMTVNAINSEALEQGCIYTAKLFKPTEVAAGIVGNLSVSVVTDDATGQKTDAVCINLIDTKPDRAEDILNELVKVYNEQYIDYKNITVRKSIEFIDDRLLALSQELGNVENSYKNYQSSLTLVDIGAKESYTVSTNVEYRNQLNEIKLQRSLLSMI